MACDTQRSNPNQTLEERKAEVKATVDKLSQDLAAGRVKAVVGTNGGIAFQGFDANRNGVTDACAYRRLMVTGSALAKSKIAAAEALSGRSVNKVAIGQGLHSHDGGKTWHNGH